jgi:DNA-binding CsgD family transcriptional regulator
VAWLTEVGGSARLLALAPAQPLRIGRSDDNDVILADDLKVSRHHAELICRQGAWWVRDCSSRNGTHLNGTLVHDTALSEGDRLRLGTCEFVFSLAEDPLATLDDARPGAPTQPELSPRETEIIAWVASGATDIQIARALGITLATVHSHLDRIRDKTGRRRRPDLTRLASELGLGIPNENKPPT